MTTKKYKLQYETAYKSHFIETEYFDTEEAAERRGIELFKKTHDSYGQRIFLITEVEQGEIKCLRK